MRRGSAGFTGAGVVALGVTAALALPAGAPAAKLERCEKRSPVRCGNVSVPLDRTGAVAGTVRLAVAKIPARKKPRAGTLMLIAGGPGESSRDALALAGPFLSAALPRFDIVAFDQRGTGRSGQLRCRALRKSSARRSVAGAMARCARQLGPRRAFYRTTDSVDDLETVRRYLGAPSLSLMGVSYGARVAGEYARRYPASVARLVLDSPVPLTGTDPFNRQVQAALPGVLGAVCAGDACPFTRSAYGDLTQLAQRLREGPMRGRVVDRRGEARRAALSERLLHGLVSASDLDPLVRAQLPAGIASALRGDPAPLLRLAASAASGLEDSLSLPLTAATLCSESPLPWDPAQPPGPRRAAALNAAVAALGERPFAPFRPSTIVDGGLVSVCRRWPAVPNRPAPAAGVSAAPTLILSGSEDLRTPTEQARTIASGYSAATVLSVPQTGHSVIGGALRPCASRALSAFLRGKPVSATCPDRRRPSLMAVAKPPPARLADVPGRSRQQRLRKVARLTIRDAVGQLLSKGRRFGGLRGGTASVERRRLILDRYEYVRGVEVSGRLRSGKKDRIGGTVELRVGGAAPVRVRL